jgi:hypothetical protein
MFLVGMVLLLFTSIVFTGSLDLVKPDKPFQQFTGGQALLVALGFALVSVWQIYVNQASLLPALQSFTVGGIVITPGPQLSYTFAVDAGIAEETLMAGAAIILYVTAVYFKAGKPLAVLSALIAVSAFFTWLHLFVLGDSPAALTFVAGARIILTGVLFGTLFLSRKAAHRTASLAAPATIHVLWNIVTVGH